MSDKKQKKKRRKRKVLVRKARHRRTNPTSPEKLLWGKLRKRQIDGKHFRRQHVLDGEILDFYCAELKIAVEVKEDDYLNSGKGMDRRLSREHGIYVIRLAESQVMDDLESAVEDITRVVSDAQKDETA